MFTNKHCSFSRKAAQGLLNKKHFRLSVIKSYTGLCGGYKKEEAIRRVIIRKKAVHDLCCLLYTLYAPKTYRYRFFGDNVRCPAAPTEKSDIVRCRSGINIRPLTRAANITRRRRISLRSNRTRRQANITEARSERKCASRSAPRGFSLICLQIIIVVFLSTS